mgnify:CR=1 FL=1
MRKNIFRNVPRRRNALCRDPPASPPAERKKGRKQRKKHSLIFRSAFDFFAVDPIVPIGGALRSFRLFQASRANVTFHFFAVFHVRNFLYVGFERSSGFTIGVADVVSGSLTLTANVANS